MMTLVAVICVIVFVLPGWFWLGYAIYTNSRK